MTGKRRSFSKRGTIATRTAMRLSRGGPVWLLHNLDWPMRSVTGSWRQRSTSSRSWMSWMRARALREVPHLPNPLTAGEMSQLPAYAEQKLAEPLHESLTPAQAAQPAIWTMCHAAWIARGDFGSNLAAIFCEGPRANTVEARTRNFLRRTGGLRRVRGNTSPLVDCPISAAWWRYRVALEASSIAKREGSDLAVAAAHETVRTRDVWDYLVGMSLRQVTSVCASTARSAAVVALRAVSTNVRFGADSRTGSGSGPRTGTLGPWPQPLAHPLEGTAASRGARHRERGRR